jgi:signal transduction histidine kinase
MPRKSRAKVIFVSIFCLAAVVALRVWWFPVLGTESPVLLLVPVMLGAWLGGRGLGVLVTLIAVLLHLLFFTPPFARFHVPAGDEAVRLAAFAFEGLAISWMAGQLHAARRRAEEAVAERDRFLAIASHELNNPLNALGLSIALLQRTSGERERKPLALARRQVRRLQRLVGDLLELSRIAAGQISLERRRVDLAAVVEDAVDALREEAEVARCELRVLAREPIVGELDPDRLEQVVINLLSNAIKYGRGAPIELEVGRIGERARLVVRDRGVGIPSDEQQGVFDAFSRASTARASGARGVGLGLWIVKTIVNQHGGEVRVTSVPGEGSEFVVELPLGNPQQARASLARSADGDEQAGGSVAGRAT